MSHTLLLRNQLMTHLNKTVDSYLTIIAMVTALFWTTHSFAAVREEMPTNTTYITSKDNTKEDTIKSIKAEKKTSFGKKLLKPIKWIMNNWSAYDPAYSTPSFYSYVGQFENNFSNEWIDIKYPGNNKISMHSRLSSKIGPKFGYSFLMYGYTIDLNALRGTNRRRDMSLSINSNLINANIIYRRTGGDFILSKLTNGQYDPHANDIIMQDITDMASIHNMGDMMKLDVTGININYFTNHRKYSNPAAFSNGAIQLRSVGSPIVGLGFTHHRLESSMCDVFETNTFKGVFEKLSDKPAETSEWLYKLSKDYNADIHDLSSLRHFMVKTYEAGDISTYKHFVSDIFNNPLITPILFGSKLYNEIGGVSDIRDQEIFNSLINTLPSSTSYNDLHLQLGYAYNIVFSRRLLLGLSAIAAPSVKWIKYDNNRNLCNIVAEELTETMEHYYEFPSDVSVPQELFRDNKSYTQFGVDVFGRASLTYNFNRWRAGINANVNAYLLKSFDMTMNNIYGNACVYVGYCFGRKKQYRWNGKDRQAYITAALTRNQIKEMNDTIPEGNISKGDSYLKEWGKTRYHKDNFNFDIQGCDLVKGPDGHYGSFEIQDGLVTQGEDTEGRLRPGTTLYMNKDGDIEVEAGHRLGFLAGNWWKSQLQINQIPTNWYPEMLHYGLKGKLTLYVRSYTFGTKQPVKVEIEDFCICHGKETKQLYQIGAQSFQSHSSYSIVGTANVNNRLCRVYIESKKRGTRNTIYINRLKASGSNWMHRIEDTRAISRISMPGTHDAGAASLPETGLTHMGHTQNFSISEQLLDGIRAFDIRLKKNMKYGHSMTCREGFDETLVDIRKFLHDNPSEFIVALIGSDESGKWSDEMKQNYKQLIEQYSDLFIEDFSANTPVKDVRGKILVIRRQEDCPYGKLLKFEDNSVFNYDCFYVEDVYKEHKTYKKIKIVEQHLRDAYENDDPNKWYFTFNSIAWDPRHHKPYYSAWGAVNVRKPMNKSLREVIEIKDYNNLGIIFLDFYNDHGDKPQLVESIINSNFHINKENDYIPYNK